MRQDDDDDEKVNGNEWNKEYFILDFNVELVLSVFEDR